MNKSIILYISQDGSAFINKKNDDLSWVFGDLDNESLLLKYENIIEEKDILLIKKLRGKAYSAFFSFLKKIDKVLKSKWDEDISFENLENDLHPVIITIIINLIIYTFKQKNININILTNSEIVISQISKNIARKNFTSNHVKIFYFKNSRMERNILFHKNGQLDNWKKGFFDFIV